MLRLHRLCDFAHDEVAATPPGRKNVKTPPPLPTRPAEQEQEEQPNSGAAALQVSTAGAMLYASRTCEGIGDVSTSRWNGAARAVVVAARADDGVGVEGSLLRAGVQLGAGIEGGRASSALARRGAHLDPRDGRETCAGRLWLSLSQGCVRIIGAGVWGSLVVVVGDGSSRVMK